MKQVVHIVCLDCPSPPDYGGAIDMFYKIKALHENGASIRLHYFDYNSSRNPKAVAPYCDAVYAYQRKPLLRSLPLRLPYIIQSRINEALIKRLNADTHPILLEGLHCSGMIPFLHHKERIVLRMHNDEASYYRHLAKAEKSLLKRSYFWQESRSLHRYQLQLAKTIKLAFLSESDMHRFRDSYGFKQLHLVPCFIPWQTINCREGKGPFCLYHGNLSVAENEEAAGWLIEHVFSKTDCKLVIAGKGVSHRLRAKVEKNGNVRLVNNPSISEIDNLVKEAQINVLPSLNNTGVKLKLLNALLNGRYCLTNPAGVAGSSIQNGVVVQDTAQDWINSINSLMDKAFPVAAIEDRKKVLALYNNHTNAQSLSALWSHCQ